MVRFSFNESKTLEALVFVARQWDGITPFYLSKVLFFADSAHLRAYGRPVTGDQYIAMVDGPVPSHAYDIVKGKWDFLGNPDAVAEALKIDRDAQYPRVSAKRAPDLDLLSETDVIALAEAIEFCRGKPFAELSNLTHQEPAWASAPLNSEMDLELLVPEEDREEVRENAAYTIL